MVPVGRQVPATPLFNPEGPPGAGQVRRWAALRGARPGERVECADVVVTQGVVEVLDLAAGACDVGDVVPAAVG